LLVLRDALEKLVEWAHFEWRQVVESAVSTSNDALALNDLLLDRYLGAALDDFS
jgi:hypothetical protein